MGGRDVSKGELASDRGSGQIRKHGMDAYDPGVVYSST